MYVYFSVKLLIYFFYSLTFLPYSEEDSDSGSSTVTSSSSSASDDQHNDNRHRQHKQQQQPYLMVAHRSKRERPQIQYNFDEYDEMIKSAVQSDEALTVYERMCSCVVRLPRLTVHPFPVCVLVLYKCLICSLPSHSR